jgi:RNA polymerase sigma factor (sigma-70 family)
MADRLGSVDVRASGIEICCSAATRSLGATSEIRPNQIAGFGVADVLYSGMPTDNFAAESRERSQEDDPIRTAPTGAESSNAAPDDIDRLFREHNQALLRFITAKLGSTQEAKDVAQEAYVRLLGLGNRAAVSYLRAFLFKTAANIATDRLRERTRRGYAVNPQNLDAAIFELSPERQIDGERALQRLHDGIAELPDKCREAFLLYRLDGLRGQDIATRLGIQERMVWLYIARALEYLRDRVEGTSSPNASGAAP